MKFCLINNLYKPYARGGAERMVEMTAQGLCEQGHDVVVITAAPDKQHETCKVEAGATNITINRLYSSNLAFYGNLGELPKPLRLVWHLIDMGNVATALRVKKIVEKEKPDVIVLHNLKGLSYLVPKFLKKENLVLVPHDVQLIEPSGVIYVNQELRIKNQGVLARFYAKINQILFNDIKTVISPSGWLLDFYTNKGFFKNAKKFVLHNPALIVEIMNQESGIRNRLKLLFVGQLEESKGILFLITALKNNTLDSLAYTFTIVGDGSKRREVQKLIVGDERFIYAGKLEGFALQNAYQEADYTVVPSLVYENCPTVILESFANGTPVIASAAGGIPELVEDGKNGFLFNPGDDVAFGATLARAKEHNWQNLSEGAKLKANALSISNYINKFLNLASSKK